MGTGNFAILCATAKSRLTPGWSNTQDQVLSDIIVSLESLGRRLAHYKCPRRKHQFKIVETDPVSSVSAEVLWVRGSGGDLGSIRREGFATIYLDKLVSLMSRYRGVAREDEMVEFYHSALSAKNIVAASIDTSLHASLPFRHVDHLHPDWGIALAATAVSNARGNLKSPPRVGSVAAAGI